MTGVTVSYRLHEGYWGAESSQITELVAGDASLESLKELVHCALRDFTGSDPLEIVDVVEGLATAQPTGEFRSTALLLLLRR